jgi:GNAT superfamily N-acetyltransferase
LNELEDIERSAYRSMWRLVPDDVAEEHGIATAELGGGTCIACRADTTTMLNRASGVGVGRAATEDDLDEIISFFNGRADRFAVAIAATAQPLGLTEMLRDRGFQPGYAWMKFRRITERPVRAATDLVIEEVDSQRAEDYGRVIAEGFGLSPSLARWWSCIVGAPGWHCFVGYDGREPAAAGSLYIEEEVAWFGVAATRPAFRGRGGQSAILTARVEAAARLGAKLVTTETGERIGDRPSGSYRNILRAGFEEAYLRPNYERGPRTG